VNEETSIFPENLTFTSKSFLNLLESIVRHFGPAGEPIVFQMGRENGMAFCREVLSTVNHHGASLKELLELVLRNASKVGWANMEIEEFNTQTGNIRVVLKDNTFREFCLQTNLPQCFFLRGYLAGILKELSNVDYLPSHSGCYAEGHEHCSIKLVASSE
jgi:predicted hydrocarbon binding protein